MRKLALIVLLLTSFAHGADVNCQQETWANTPAVRNGLFKGHLVNTCVLTNLPQVDVNKLADYFKDKTRAESHVLHSTATANGKTTYDSTVRSEDGLMRSLISISARPSLVYSSVSKEIDFSGMAGYLQKLEVVFVVEKISDSSVRVKLENKTEIKKPALAPAGIFNNIAQKDSKEKFRTEFKRLVDEISQNL